MLTVSGDHAGDRLYFAFAVRVLIDYDLSRIKDRSVINIFHADGAAASMDVEAALVEIVAGFPQDIHFVSFLICADHWCWSPPYFNYSLTDAGIIASIFSASEEVYRNLLVLSETSVYIQA